MSRRNERQKKSREEEPRIIKAARLKKSGVHAGMNRRNFVKTGILGYAGSVAALSLNSCSKETGKCESEVTLSHGNDISSVAISPDGGKVFSAGESWYDYTKIWNAENGSLVRKIEMKWYSWTVPLELSPDGTMIAVGADERIKILSASDGSDIRTLVWHDGGVNSLAFSPDGTKIISGSGAGTIKLWNVSDGSLIRTFTGHTGNVSSLKFSPDGAKILSGGTEGNIILWNITNGSIIKTIEDNENIVWAVAFSPDGTKIVSGGDDRTVKLWNVSDGSLVNTYEGHTDVVNSVIFNADGTKIISGSDDHTIKIWDLILAGNIITINDHLDAVNSLALSSDGARLVSGSSDGFVALWDLAVYALIRTMADPGVTAYVGEFIDCDEDADPLSNIYQFSCSCDSVCTCDIQTSGSGCGYWYPN